MGDNGPTLDPTEALADIQTLVSVALRSDNMTAVQRDLEMILTIVEMVLPPKKRFQSRDDSC